MMQTCLLYTSSDDTTEASDDDQKAADEVGALIDKIYVQERTDTTDEDCKAAKEAWDKLTDAQKELVTGEEASPESVSYTHLDVYKRQPHRWEQNGSVMNPQMQMQNFLP